MGWKSFISSVAKIVSAVTNNPIFNFISPILSFVGIAMTALSWLNRPDEPEFNQDTTTETRVKGILANKTSGNGPLPIIYGTRKVGGHIVFLETSGTDNEFLYMIFVLGEGQLNACSTLFIDDRQVTLSGALTHGTARTVASSDSNFYKDSTSHITATWYDGRDDQTYDTTVGALTNWTSNHRLRGVSYLALKFKWNVDIFASVPDVKCVVQGKKVYDPRTTSTSFSSNPALCILDYLRNSRYGMGIGDANFTSSFSDFTTAANVCDTSVTPYSGASNINIFNCNAVLDTKSKVIDNVKQLLTGCRGYLNYTGGKYKILIETTGSASITLTEDNIIGGIGVSSKDKNTRYNRVVVRYVNPDKNYQTDEAQFPPIDDSSLPSADQHSTMLTTDNNVLLEGRFETPTITNFYQAEEMAEVILRRSRASLDVSLTVDSTGLDLAIGDIVNITHATPGFSAKPFRVMGITINTDLTVNLQCIEHQDSYYTWATKTQAATVPTTNLPDPFSITAPSSITLTDELIEYNDGTVITRLNISLGASADKFVQYYIVEAKQTSESEFKVIGQATHLTYEMLNVVDNVEYTVRAKAVNSLGISSSYITATRTIVGGVDAPSNVEDFAIEMHGQNQMRLTWTVPSADTDLDISYYEIRYQNVTSGAKWLNSTNLIRVTRRKSDNALVNARTGAYLIKAIDKAGNESLEPTIIYTNIAGIQSFQNISTITETLSLTGSQDNMDATYPLAVKLDDSGDIVLTLDTITNFDDTQGNFDSASGEFELGGTDTSSNPNFNTANRDSKGFYNFDNSLSLDAIYDGNLEPTLTLDAQDPYDLFDNGRGVLFFDDAKAPFDGSEPSHAFHKIQAATSTTSLANCTSFSDISSSATYKFRYAKFRLKLYNDDNKTSSNIKGLSVKLDMEERTIGENDLVSSSGTKVIAYAKPFYASPSVGIAAQNMSTGDVFTITSKSKTGFTINFANSSGSAVDRTFDYVAKGYGLQSSP